MRWASSTIAASSAGVICAGSGSSRTTERAPVAITLMKPAPARICSRTALRISSGPSASRYMVPKMAPPGEVAEMMRPHGITRGPSSKPRSTAWRTAMPSSS